MLLFNLSLADGGEERNRLAEIYQKYLGWMLKISYHYLQSQEDAEDAVANVFVNLAKAVHSIPWGNEKDTKAYLFICVRNSTFNLLKANARHKTVSFDTLFNIPSNVSTEETVQTSETLNSLFCFIEKMDVIYRDVLTLYIKFGMSLKEISDVLGTPFKTVETRFNRGKSILKERFGDLDI